MSADEEFEAADAEFSLACRAFNDASDKLWAATKRRSEAWRNVVKASLPPDMGPGDVKALFSLPDDDDTMHSERRT